MWIPQLAGYSTECDFSFFVFYSYYREQVMRALGGTTVYLDSTPIKDFIPLVTSLMALVRGQICQVDKFRYLVSSTERYNIVEYNIVEYNIVEYNIGEYNIV